MKVYLAGPITGLTFDDANDWRTDVEHELERYGIEALNPLRGKEHLAGIGPLPDVFDGASAALRQDLEDIDAADLVLAHFLGAERPSIGTCIELGYAYARGVPILAVADVDNPHSHMFVQYVSTFWATTLDEALERIVSTMVSS